MRLPALSVLAGALLLACSSCTESPPADSPVDTFAARYTDALCAGYVKCSTPAPDVAAQCAKAHSFEAQKEAVAAGRASFDVARADACVAAVAALSCHERGLLGGAIPDALADCGKVFRGHVAPGGSCHVDDECDDGVCVFSDATCNGVCRAKKKPGDPCDLKAQDCGYGTNACWTPSFDQPATCQRFGGDGAPCDPASSFRCKVGLGCKDDVCVPITRNAQEGESCWSEYEWCADGLVCAYDVCVALPGEGEQCSSLGCRAGLTCKGYGVSAYELPYDVFFGTCAPPSGLGGSCLRRGISSITGCEAGLNCVDDHCVMPPESGPCEFPDYPICALGHYCAECVPQEPNDTCAECKPQKLDGVPCTDTNECASHVCRAGVCAPVCARGW